MSNSREMTIAVMLRHIGDRGGVTVYTRNILEHMVSIDRNNRYLLLYSSAEHLGSYSRYPNVQEILVKGSGGLADRIVWDQSRIFQEIRKHHVDIIYNPKLSVPLTASCRTAFTMHGLEQFAAAKLFLWYDRLYSQTFMRLYCRKADAIFVMTETGRRDIQKYLGVKSGKIHVVPESYNENCRAVENTDILRAVKKKFALPDRFILFVGGVVPLKNISILLKALHLLKEKGYPHKLVLVGFRRWGGGGDIKIRNSLGLQRDIVELGFVDTEDLPAIYSQADCLVMPSFYEGFGIPILEAQACGCPVVISSGGAMPEVAGSGGALVFNPYDPAELASRIEVCLLDKDARNKLISTGLKNVKKYSWEKTARATIDILTSVAHSGCPVAAGGAENA